MKVIALYNLKGGVGKTSTCVNLAYQAAEEGNATLLWDLDPQAAATFYYELKPKLKGGVEKLLSKKVNIHYFIKATKYKRLDVIPSDVSNRNMDLLLDDLKKSEVRFKKMIQSLSTEYSYLFIDCPPALNLLSEHIFGISDHILIPTIPSTLSERTYLQIKRHFNKQKFDKSKIIPFFSMVDLRKKMHKETMGNFSGSFKQALDARIPNSSIIERMGEHKAPVFAFARNSRPAQAYRSLWAEIKGLA